MEYIVSPNIYKPNAHERSLYLAGGITGCPDWQQEIVQLLEHTNLVMFNPRRKSFPMNDPKAAEEQIEWEHFHLRQADVIAFWFPRETICPIALYELGAWSMTDKPMSIGVHPEYPRRLDVEKQTKLVRPDVEIVYSLADLAGRIIKSYAEGD